MFYSCSYATYNDLLHYETIGTWCFKHLRLNVWFQKIYQDNSMRSQSMNTTVLPVVYTQHATDYMVTLPNEWIYYIPYVSFRIVGCAAACPFWIDKLPSLRNPLMDFAEIGLSSFQATSVKVLPCNFGIGVLSGFRGKEEYKKEKKKKRIQNCKAWNNY